MWNLVAAGWLLWGGVQLASCTGKMGMVLEEDSSEDLAPDHQIYEFLDSTGEDKILIDLVASPAAVPPPVHSIGIPPDDDNDDDDASSIASSASSHNTRRSRGNSFGQQPSFRASRSSFGGSTSELQSTSFGGVSRSSHGSTPNLAITRFGGSSSNSIASAHDMQASQFSGGGRRTSSTSSLHSGASHWRSVRDFLSRQTSSATSYAGSRQSSRSFRRIESGPHFLSVLGEVGLEEVELASPFLIEASSDAEIADWTPLLLSVIQKKELRQLGDDYGRSNSVAEFYLLSWPLNLNGIKDADKFREELKYATRHSTLRVHKQVRLTDMAANNRRAMAKFNKAATAFRDEFIEQRSPIPREKNDVTALVVYSFLDEDFRETVYVNVIANGDEKLPKEARFTFFSKTHADGALQRLRFQCERGEESALLSLLVNRHLKKMIPKSKNTFETCLEQQPRCAFLDSLASRTPCDRDVPAPDPIFVHPPTPFWVKNLADAAGGVETLTSLLLKKLPKSEAAKVIYLVKIFDDRSDFLLDWETRDLESLGNDLESRYLVPIRDVNVQRIALSGSKAMKFAPDDVALMKRRGLKAGAKAVYLFVFGSHEHENDNYVSLHAFKSNSGRQFNFVKRRAWQFSDGLIKVFEEALLTCQIHKKIKGFEKLAKELVNRGCEVKKPQDMCTILVKAEESEDWCPGGAENPALGRNSLSTFL